MGRLRPWLLFLVVACAFALILAIAAARSDLLA